MSNTEPYKALIIGCGAVAGGYDSNKQTDNAILSHMGAYDAHDGFKVVACIDPDEQARKDFCDYWKIEKSYVSIDRAVAEGCEFDVASLTSPTLFHEEGLRALLKTSVKAVWAEKPITSNFEISTELVAAYEEQAIALSVNYFRRFDPEIIKLKNEISSGRWGRLQNVNVQYCKGVNNSGSHFINLLQYLIGEVSPHSVLRCQYDYLKDDPTLDAVLMDAYGTPIFLAGSDSSHMFLGELDFVFEKGRVHLEDVGTMLRKRHQIESPIYAGYTWLEEGVRVPTGFKRCFYKAVDNLYRHLKFQDDLISDGKSALATAQICDQLLAKLESENGQ